MIKFTLMKSTLSTSDKSPYFPKTIQEGSISFQEAIKKIAFGSTVTAPDVKAVLARIEQVCIDSLAQGRSINLGFCTLRPQVKGNFQKLNEPYSKKKHWVEVSVSINGNLGKQVSEIANVRRITSSKVIPQINFIENDSDSSGNYKAGDLVTIKGVNLRFAKNNMNLGIFIQNKKGLFRVNEYSVIEGKKISFKIPANIPSGSDYKLSMKNQFGKEVRLGEYSDFLKIQ